MHEIKAEKQRVSYMRYGAVPGFQAQMDFGEFLVKNLVSTILKLFLFSMILGYSCKIYGELFKN